MQLSARRPNRGVNNMALSDKVTLADVSVGTPLTYVEAVPLTSYSGLPLVFSAGRSRGLEKIYSAATA
jgi:hypothetical protein